MFHSALLQNGVPTLGTTFQRVHKLKTWRGVARRILRGPRPDHAPSHTFEVSLYFGDSIYGKPHEIRRIEVTLTTYKIGHAIYQG